MLQRKISCSFLPLASPVDGKKTQAKVSEAILHVQTALQTDSINTSGPCVPERAKGTRSTDHINSAKPLYQNAGGFTWISYVLFWWSNLCDIIDLDDECSKVDHCVVIPGFVFAATLTNDEGI